MYNLTLTSTGFHVSLSGVGAKGADGAGAYAHAVAGGYSGTELQFNTYLADLSASATAAANSAMGAAVSATSAEDSAESALTSAATAITKSDQASASAVAAATSATTASSASTAATASAVAALASQNSATLGASTATTQAVIATTQADLSKEWATKTSSEVVAGQGFGALKYASDAAASAATATTKASEASTSATNAASSETVATTKASAASTSATNAASSATVATTKASEASTSATNAASSATAATTKASEASTSATNATSSATVATTKASEASTSATNAASSETAATNAASTASTHASTASTHANKAQQWADADLNVQVESGKYSAKHWAAQAQASVTGAIIYRGAFSATSGLYPAVPVSGDYYKISATGTLGGVVHVTGDSIIYNGTTWDKIGSTDAVTSVAGRVGAVIVTKTDIDLANVDNTSDVNKPVSTATQTALSLKADLASPAFTGTPTGITKSHVGLGNVDNTSDVDKPVSTATQTALNGKADLANPTFTGTVGGVTKGMVGLANVDNTSDAAKPVSTAQQTALNEKEPAIAVGTTAQYWRGDKTWRDFFTDVRAATLTGLSTATDAIITTADTVLSALGKLQKQISDNLTTLTSHTGNTSNPHGVTKAQVGLDNVDNTADSAKPVSTAQQTALDAKQAALVSGSNIKTVNGNSLLGGGDLSITAGISDAPSDGKTYGRKNAAWAEAAPLASPTFTGTPAAPTAAVGTNTTQLATTAHVFAERAATATLTNKTLTTPLITGTREVRVAMPANAIDLATGNLFTKTISGATTLTVSNVPTTGTAASFILELTNAGSAAITWFPGVKWAGGTAPTLTASGVDVLGFYSHDGGTTWRGLVLAKDSK